jgi:ferritin-like metal-binding protein YciE
MEKQAVEICQRQSERYGDSDPAIASRLAQHLQETHSQMAKLDRCFAILDEEPSVLRSSIGAIGGNLQAIAAMFADDNVIKAAMAAYVFEQLEISSYTVLIAAAETAGENDIARLCRAILVQEEAMADWLLEHLPELSSSAFQSGTAMLDAAGHKAVNKQGWNF